MTKHICDICKVNTASNHFKIKQLQTVAVVDDYGVFPEKMWVNIDICENCIKQIVEGSKEGEKI